MATKVCRACKQEHDEADFPWRTDIPTMHIGTCTACTAQQRGKPTVDDLGRFWKALEHSAEQEQAQPGSAHREHIKTLLKRPRPHEVA